MRSARKVSRPRRKIRMGDPELLRMTMVGAGAHFGVHKDDLPKQRTRSS